MMTTGEINDLMYHVFVLAVKIGGPILIVGMAIGVIISIIQAATQIHEQTLSFVPKLFVIGCILVMFGGTMLKQLQELTQHIFKLMIG